MRQIQSPVPRVLGPVLHAPSDVTQLYEEARSAHTAGAFTAAVLSCRKTLMRIAVGHGDPQGGSFLQYVEYLDGQHLLGRSLG
jgi:hypothetical protein